MVVGHLTDTLLPSEDGGSNSVDGNFTEHLLAINGMEKCIQKVAGNGIFYNNDKFHKSYIGRNISRV